MQTPLKLDLNNCRLDSFAVQTDKERFGGSGWNELPILPEQQRKPIFQ